MKRITLLCIIGATSNNSRSTVRRLERSGRGLKLRREGDRKTSRKLRRGRSGVPERRRIETGGREKYVLSAHLNSNRFTVQSEFLLLMINSVIRKRKSESKRR